MAKLSLLTILLLAGRLVALAQDPQYSQYFGAALYHNPAFAGTSTPDRITLNHRIQWPGLPAPYVSTAFAYDHAFVKTGTSLGMVVNQDVAGVSRFRTIAAGGILAQSLKVNRTIRTTIALQVGFEQRDIDLNSLVFPDQVTQDGITSSTQEPAKSNSTTYVNTALGALVHSKYWWVGLSVHNLNQPSIEPLGNPGATLLPRTTINAGLRFPLQDERYLLGNKKADAILPSVMYRSQGSVSQVDFGALVELQPLVFGLYSRGLPFLQNIRGVFTQDAIVFLMGVNIGETRICYSYDYNTSAQLSAFQGAHELGIQFGFNAAKLLNARRGPCPGM